MEFITEPKFWTISGLTLDIIGVLIIIYANWKRDDDLFTMDYPRTVYRERTKIFIGLSFLTFGFLFQIIGNFSSDFLKNTTQLLIFLSTALGTLAFVISKYLLDSKAYRIKYPFFKAFNEYFLIIRFNKPFLTIPLPIITSVLLNLFLVYLFKKPLIIESYMLQYSILERVVVNGIMPSIFEEIMFRSILLGTFLVIIDTKLKDKKCYKVLFSLILFSQALLFTIFHDNDNLIDFIGRFLRGLYYSILYVVYDKNIIPSVIGHMTNNLLTILTPQQFWKNIV